MEVTLAQDEVALCSLFFAKCWDLASSNDRSPLTVTTYGGNFFCSTRRSYQGFANRFARGH